MGLAVQSEALARTVALHDLIELRKSVFEAVARLSVLGVNQDEELVRITPLAVTRVLDGYLAGELSSGEVEQWAEALFMRDDVGFYEEHEYIMTLSLFRFSTPELTSPITRDVACAWKKRLRLEHSGVTVVVPARNGDEARRTAPAGHAWIRASTSGSQAL
ncbi:hypothetical protein [Saccharomonospora iraqiensis]|uniref:hypothetical protein n=1 Tax=Saccharomonospora iraqiensis TaxID=52698 RepID=UPI0012FA15E2|nr:hypothetical protein [Saccharomonospora iraqiensis]